MAYQDKNFYIFRHGETKITKENRRWYGRRVFSAHILDEGKSAIGKLATYLKDIKTDYNVSSQFRRCRETVDIVNEITGKEFEFDKRLNEFFLETFGHLKKRVIRFLEQTEKSGHKDILICTHGVVIAALINLILYERFTKKDWLVYPKPGVLTVIKNGEMSQLDFNS